MEIIDAYSHCGLKKYEPIETVQSVMAASGVSRAVLVQHLGEFDNSYIGGIAARDPEHFAGVCLVDATSPVAVQSLQTLAASGQFKGVRFTIDVCTFAPELFQAAVDVGLIIVLYAPEGVAKAIGPLINCLDARPTARLVLRHLGTPNLADGPEFVAARQ